MNKPLHKFLSNKKSALALIIFLLCVFFAVIGPYLTPYDYSYQYRNSINLKPLQFSDKENLIRSISPRPDLFYSASLQPGSITELSKGYYSFNYKTSEYYFSLERDLQDAVIVFYHEKNNPSLYIVKEGDIKNGTYIKKSDLKIISGYFEDAASLEMKSYVFPHFFGTDSNGRDVMTRTMFGTRISLTLGVLGAFITILIGFLYGAISGYLGGRIDFIMMRIVDVIYSIPVIMIILILQVVIKEPLKQLGNSSSQFVVSLYNQFGTSLISIIITFSCFYWVSTARIIRGQVLKIRQLEYIMVARTMGLSPIKMIFKHILPACCGTLIVTMCMQIPSAVFLESFLSFLGVGVSAPMTSLGSLCSEGLNSIYTSPTRLFFPSAILTVLVLSLNLIGDGIKEALDVED